MDTKHFILLVNRESKYLEAVSAPLNDAGYGTLTATTMSDALKLLSGNPVSLIIGDCELPDADGYDFLARLRNDSVLKKIPFMFLVSARFIIDPLEEEVSKILRAFEMGAVDFIVDTLEEDISRGLIKRIKKILPPDGVEKSKPSTPLFQDEKPAPQAAPERRDSRRIIPKQTVNIDISRDRVLWMPGRITNINEQGLKIETSLLGKLDMLLYIRVPLPNKQHLTAKSHIKHIAISQNSSSAEIGVQIDESVEWIEIYNYVAKLMGIVNKPSSREETPLPPGSERTLSIRERDEKNQFVYIDPLMHNTPESVDDTAALEMKFYRSLIGKQLGNYRVVSFIGAGSMAGVFKGWDVGLERNVALKIISYNLSTIESYREMFFKEARLVSRLLHPHIAQIYHIDHMDDVFYFVMELVNGGTLADLLKDRNKLNVATCLEQMITVCKTLDFVSKKNVIHRDIKPANIMVDDRGIVKIVDFGVAVVNDEANTGQKNGVAGTPLYTSPECIMGQPPDFGSDIYSLGATFYHVFAGVPPFEGSSLEIIRNKHLNEYAIPLKKRNPMISGDLSDIIDKMLAKKPKERYPNYRALINDLTEVVH